jgi:hypothetical protein
MVLVKVEYDAYNRRFKLLDRELARFLEDGEQYLLIASAQNDDEFDYSRTFGISNEDMPLTLACPFVR